MIRTRIFTDPISLYTHQGAYHVRQTPRGAKFRPVPHDCSETATIENSIFLLTGRPTRTALCYVAFVSIIKKYSFVAFVSIIKKNSFVAFVSIIKKYSFSL
jgi:hypothetical protein